MMAAFRGAKIFWARSLATAILLPVALLASQSHARPPIPGGIVSAPVAWPDADHDPAIPTTGAVLGLDIGSELVRHGELRSYFDALAAAAPDRVRLFDIGRSWQGRSLFYAAISSPANIARLEEIQAGMARLADPRGLGAGEAAGLIDSLPAVVWLGHSIHGNEPGTSNAALQTAYHLLASRGDPRVASILDETVVLIAPLINPDGRERFIDGYRAGRGLEPDPSPLSAERDEPWPGGRTNHYLFDMNRDWFTQTQPEIRAHAAALLAWMPVVVVDLHEMGTDRTYFFPPEAEPFNPHLTPTQLANTGLVGRNNAAWFDRFGLRYFTREVYDGFFPGYGSGWPNYHGASAMVFEQASSRGLVARRTDGSILRFSDTVQSQFIASLSTLEVAASNRAKFLQDFADYRATAVEEGRRERTRAYVLSAEPDPDLAARLAVTLARNGIELERALAPFQGCGRSFPAGSFIVPAAQPAKRLLRTLLDEKTAMDPAFLAQQAERVSRGLPDEIYDVTAWSLPLMFNVPAHACASVPTVGSEPIGPDWRLPGQVSNPQARVAFLVPWGSTASARFLAAALRAGITVHSSGKPFTASGTRFPAGSLVIPVAGAGDLGPQLRQLSADSGATVIGVDDGWVSDGPGLGSPSVRFMPTPRVALLWDEPTDRSSAGSARFVLERQFGYPVTPIRSQRLATATLDGFDVLVIPGEARSYKDVLGKAGIETLKSWVSRGGVVVALGSGTRFLADPEVDLLPIRLEDDAFAAPAAADAAQPDAANGKESAAMPARVPGSILANEAELAQATLPERNPPRPIAGALAHAVVADAEHWLAAGLSPTLNVLVTGNDIYSPARQNAADTVLRFAGPEALLKSGVLWEESGKQLAFKPFVVSRKADRGLAIGFTSDPNFRAHLAGLNLAFFNAIFRGAAMVHDANTARARAPLAHNARRPGEDAQR